MDTLAEGMLSRLRMHVEGGNSVDRLSDWLASNTSSPKDPNKKWSFDGHEYQIEILNDTTPELDARKCSQVGFSEITARQALGIAAIRQGIHIIYTLPTAAFSRVFTKSRVDPVIESSKTLRDMLSKEVDGSEQKRIGNSFVYFRGTIGQQSAISIPASALIHDELDFSDLDNVTTYSSRLGHEAESDIFKRRFSTPTSSGRAIDAGFKEGSQKYYAVRHDPCGKLVIPDFFADSVIPGYDGDTLKLRAEDLRVPRYQFDLAYLKCPDCGKPISQENLINPAKRQWVAKYPERSKASYQVSPFDVAKINPPSRTWRQMGDFKRYADWVNFKCGLTSDDADNSVLPEIFERDNAHGNFYTVPFFTPKDYIKGDEPMLWGTYAGLDVGKTSWFTVGIREPYNWAHPSERRRMKVLYVERIEQNGEDWLNERLGQLIQLFGISKLVVDAAPDFTTSMGIVRRFPGLAYACRYVPNVRRTENGLVNSEADELSGVVQSYRTGTLDDLVKELNEGGMILPQMPEEERDTLTKHLKSLKKAPKVNDQGEADPDKMVWETVGNDGDHYAHSLNYLRIAESLDEITSSREFGYALAGTARTKGGEDPNNWRSQQ